MDIINFYKFVVDSGSQEILSAKLVESDETIKAYFFLDKDIDFDNQTKLSDEDYLINKYKSLVNLYLLRQDLYLDNKKEIEISIKPEF